MTTDQPSFLTQSDLIDELEAAQRRLAQHLDVVQSFGSSPAQNDYEDLEYHLQEIRHWATTVRVVHRLLEGAHRE